MNLVADESVDQPIVDRLRQDGHTVLSIADLDPGIADNAVLRLADQNSALLLTADKDFGELVFRMGNIHTGVVLTRLAGLSPETKARIVSAGLLTTGTTFHLLSVSFPLEESGFAAVRLIPIGLRMRQRRSKADRSRNVAPIAKLALTSAV